MSFTTIRMAVGRVVLVAGVLVLLFIPYLLWGTGLMTARSQALLRTEFSKAQQRADASTPSDPSGPRAPGAGGATRAADPRSGHRQCRWVPSPSRRSTCPWWSWREPVMPSSRPVPAITQAHRCRARSAMPPSPGIAPPTCTPSTTSTSWCRATRSPSSRCKGSSSTT